jgi:hypothetical protein
MSDVSIPNKEATLAEVMKSIDSGTVVVAGKTFKVLRAFKRELLPAGNVDLQLTLTCASDS